MTNFDYANARLRAMRSRLLSDEAIIDLASANDVISLLNWLTNTPYREAVELALVGQSGLPALIQALQGDLYRRLRRCSQFFSGQPAMLAQLALSHYDVENLKAVLRGLTQNLEPELIAAALIPLGNLLPADWNILTQSGNARQAIDLLATWQIPLAQPLLTLRVKRPGATLLQMEMALEKWHFSHVMAGQNGSGQALREHTCLYADVSNVMTVLRLVGLEGKEAFLTREFGDSDSKRLLIGPGRLPFNLLVAAANQESVDKAVAILSESVLGSVLQQALSEYRISGQLNSLEKGLRRYQLSFASTFFVRYPHAIGVFLGYIVLSHNESANLRRIGHGLDLHQPAGEIVADLLLLNG